MYGTSLLHANNPTLPLTLKDAILLGLQNSLPASQVVGDTESLRLKRQRLEASKLRHAINSSIANSRNEIGDSRDLDASATETQQSVISYQQTFENGFSWKLTNTQRFERPIEGGGSESTFQKNLLSLSYPLWGKAADGLKLNNEKLALQFEEEERAGRRKKLMLQTQIALAFLDYTLNYQKWQAAQRRWTLAQQKFEQKQSTQTQLTALELQQVEVEVLDAEQGFIFEESNFRNAQEQLALWIGEADTSRLPQMPRLPPFPYTPDQLETIYEESEGRIQLLQTQIQSLQKDLQAAKLETQPGVTLGSNIGQSQSNTRDGANASVFVLIAYKFGGGESEQVAILQQQLGNLNLQLQHQQVDLRIQSRKDHAQLESSRRRAEIRQKQYELAQKQWEVNQQGFQVGQVNQDMVFGSEVKWLQAETAALQAQIEYWKIFLAVQEKIDVSVLSLLEN